MIDIPPAIAHQFMDSLRAYHAEPDAIRRDEIAAAARHALLEHMPNGARLRASDVKELFERMK